MFRQGRHKLLDNSFNNSESLPETMEPEHHNPVTSTNDTQSKQWGPFPYLEVWKIFQLIFLTLYYSLE